MKKIADHEFLLSGLDGGLLLGFLAALGTLRTADKIWPGTRMRWLLHEGGYRPVLCLDQEFTRDEFMEKMGEVLAQGRKQPVLRCKDNIRFTPEEFRQLCNDAMQYLDDDPDQAALLAAFATGGAIDKDNEVMDTALRTMRGTGHKHFLKTMAQLTDKTTTEQVEASLFHAWQYRDERLGLRFSPQEDRRYALRWKNPSQDTSLTEHGANRLAVEALPLFPVHTSGGRAETTGFSGTRLTWPIWDIPLTFPTTAFLLGLAELQEETPNFSILKQRGIVEVYRCTRFTEGKYRNFTPASAV